MHAEDLEPAEQAPTPSLLHTLLFFLMATVLLVAGQFGAVALARALHSFGPGTMRTYAQLAVSDARLGVPTQALAYVLVLVCVGAAFRWVWHRSPLAGVHWEGQAALRRAPWLLALGLFCGLANSLAGAVLPMPKDPPIMADMMRTSLGAWEMLLFGTTLAPLMEEIAFRGFLLPGLVHAFGTMERWGWVSRATSLGIGVPLSVLLTSGLFALLHGAQVSHAWAPLLLIGMVSVVLCVVRLVLHSVAASTLVHAGYNMTLFAGILIQTGGFRHLDRLN